MKHLPALIVAALAFALFYIVLADITNSSAATIVASPPSTSHSSGSPPT